MGDAGHDDQIPDGLSRPIRVGLGIAGFLALPVLYYATIIGAMMGLDGHDSSIDATEFAARVTALAVPLLLLAVIILCWTCKTRRRLAVLGAVTAAFVADLVLALALLWNS